MPVEQLLTTCLLVGLGVFARMMPTGQRDSTFLGGLAGFMTLQVGGVHMFTVFSFLWALKRFKRIPRSSAWPYVAAVFGAAPLALTGFIGPLSDNPRLGIQLVFLSMSAALIASIADAPDRRQIAMGLLASVLTNAAIALLQVFGVVPIELWHPDVSAVGRPTGLYPEPDWLGLFSALGAILAWRMIDRAYYRFLAVALLGTTLLLSFARAAWVALALIILFAVAHTIAHRRRTLRRGTVLIIAGLALGSTVGLAVVPELRENASARLTSIFVSDQTDISGQARLRQTNSLRELALSAPWYGNGLSSAGRVRIYGGVDYGLRTEGANNVASNWLLGAWNDGKLLAIPFITLLLGAAIRARRETSGVLLLVVLINSLFSNAVFFPVTWALVGLTLTHRSRARPVEHGDGVVGSGAPHPSSAAVVAGRG